MQNASGAAAAVPPIGDAAENQTRRRMISAAVSSILEIGFYRTTSNEIARRAGLTWGAIQRQFGTREGLMLAAFQNEWQELIDTMGARVDGDTTEQRIRSFFGILKSHYSRPEYFAAVQIVMNLRQDPKTSQATLDVIEQMSRKTSGTFNALLRQVLPDADFDSAPANLLFFTVRDFYIGLHVESATSLAETFQRRLKTIASQEELIIRALESMVTAEGSTPAESGPPSVSALPPRSSGQGVSFARPDAVSAATIGRLPLGFAVAKYTPAEGGGVIVVYLCDAGDVHHATLAGIDSPLTPGRHQATVSENDRTNSFELTIEPRGKVFDLTATVDGAFAHGIGIVDPEFPKSLLVSWSWGGEQAAGIVKYVISDEPHTIVPTYTSIVLAANGFDDVLGGRATGFTSNGFPGRYSIVYDGLGMNFGPFAWTISERGSALELTWDTGTRRAIEGFGFRDPDSDRSIVAVYWPTGPQRMPLSPPKRSAL